MITPKEMLSLGRVPVSNLLVCHLFNYVLEDKPRKLKQLFADAGTNISVDACNSKGQTALFVGCIKGHGKCVLILLKLGADANLRSNDGSTPVHAAAFSCSPSVLQALIEYGGDLRLHDYSNLLPRDWAIEAGRKHNKKILEYIDQLHRKSVSSIISCNPPAFTEKKSKSIAMKAITYLDASIANDCKRTRVISHGFGEFVSVSGSCNCAFQKEHETGYLAVIPLINNASVIEPETLTAMPCPPGFSIINGFWGSQAVTIKKLSKIKRNIPGQNLNANDLLIAELNIVRHLLHPHILMLMGIAVESSGNSSAEYQLIPQCFLYERIDVGSLHYVLHIKHYQLSFKDSLIFLVQVSDGLSYIHQRGYIHCCITSYGIHLVNVRCAKISDFFYTTHAEKATEIHQHFHPIFNRWLAPEILACKKPSYESDVYSFCSVVCEVMSGVIPWSGYDVESIRHQIVSKGRSLKLPVNIPKLLVSVVQKGLMVSRLRRSVNLQQLSFTLKQMLKSENVLFQEKRLITSDDAGIDVPDTILLCDSDSQVPSPSRKPSACPFALRHYRSDDDAGCIHPDLLSTATNGSNISDSKCSSFCDVTKSTTVCDAVAETKLYNFCKQKVLPIQSQEFSDVYRKDCKNQFNEGNEALSHVDVDIPDDCIQCIARDDEIAFANSLHIISKSNNSSEKTCIFSSVNTESAVKSCTQEKQEVDSNFELPTATSNSFTIASNVVHHETCDQTFFSNEKHDNICIEDSGDMLASSKNNKVTALYDCAQKVRESITEVSRRITTSTPLLCSADPTYTSFDDHHCIFNSNNKKPEIKDLYNNTDDFEGKDNTAFEDLEFPLSTENFFEEVISAVDPVGCFSMRNSPAIIEEPVFTNVIEWSHALRNMQALKADHSSCKIGITKRKLKRFTSCNEKKCTATEFEVDTRDLMRRRSDTEHGEFGDNVFTLFSNSSKGKASLNENFSEESKHENLKKPINCEESTANSFQVQNGVAEATVIQPSAALSFGQCLSNNIYSNENKKDCSRRYSLGSADLEEVFSGFADRNEYEEFMQNNNEFCLLNRKDVLSTLDNSNVNDFLSHFADKSTFSRSCQTDLTRIDKTLSKRENVFTHAISPPVVNDFLGRTGDWKKLLSDHPYSFQPKLKPREDSGQYICDAKSGTGVEGGDRSVILKPQQFFIGDCDVASYCQAHKQNTCDLKHYDQIGSYQRTLTSSYSMPSLCDYLTLPSNFTVALKNGSHSSATYERNANKSLKPMELTPSKLPFKTKLSLFKLQIENHFKSDDQRTRENAKPNYDFNFGNNDFVKSYSSCTYDCSDNESTETHPLRASRVGCTAESSDSECSYSYGKCSLDALENHKKMLFQEGVGSITFQRHFLKRTLSLPLIFPIKNNRFYSANNSSAEMKAFEHDIDCVSQIVVDNILTGCGRSDSISPLTRESTGRKKE